MGLHCYFGMLSLPDRQAFTAQSTASDKDSLAHCCASQLSDWHSDGRLDDSPPYAAPTAIAARFRALRRAGSTDGATAAAPFPRDVSPSSIFQLRHNQLHPAMDLRTPKRPRLSLAARGISHGQLAGRHLEVPEWLSELIGDRKAPARGHAGSAPGWPGGAVAPLTASSS